MENEGNDNYGRKLIQFNNRLVFVADFSIIEKYGIQFCALSNVKNVRYWSCRSDGLGELIKKGFLPDDQIDSWPNIQLPVLQLLSISDWYHD